MNHPKDLTQGEWFEFIDLMTIAENIIDNFMLEAILYKTFEIDISRYNRTENWICWRLIQLQRKRESAWTAWTPN